MQFKLPAFGLKRLRTHWLIYAGVCVACYLLFFHTDVMQTANHAYLLLESIFSGRLPYFYLDVMAHENTLYYIANAYYNIALYFVFAVFELPVFIFNAIFSLPVNETLLFFLGKFVAAVFLFGSLYIFRLIAAELEMDEKTGDLATLAFALSPPAFFSVFIMAQYDSVGLFFTLLALLYWLRGRYTLFSFLMGIAVAFKLFPLFLLVPLILLVEKRPLHIIKHGALSLWLLELTTLLFWGRTGDSALMSDLMIVRLFGGILPMAFDVPAFPLLYAALCLAAFLWNPAKERIKQIGLWLCLAAYGLLFLWVGWHPQWVLLLVPFLVLTTFAEKHRTPWFWIDVLLSAGFFLYCFIVHPSQLEGNLLDFGIVGLLTGLKTYAPATVYNPVSFYLLLIRSEIRYLPMVLFGSALLVHIAGKIPLTGGTPALRLAGGESGPPPEKTPAFLWLAFGLPLALWALPVLLTWINCFGWI